MIVSDPIPTEVETVEMRTQQDELPFDTTQDVIVAEDDPVIPPFSPPGS